MQSTQIVGLLLLAILSLSFLAKAVPSAEQFQQDDEKRRAICQRFPMDKPKEMAQLKPCILCCYDHDRQLDEKMSEMTKDCVCDFSYELLMEDEEDTKSDKIKTD